jgi:hypothetical protein
MRDAQPFLGSGEDLRWCTETTFGSGIAKALVWLIATSGGEVAEPLDYQRLAHRLEFTEAELRQCVRALIANGQARINNRHHYYSGEVLELMTPGRVAADAAASEQRRRKEEARAAKIALRGGQVNRAAIPQGLRDFVFDRDGHACVRCRTTDDLTLDHIHPWSLGGPDTADNLRVLCRSCNSSKGDRVQRGAASF